MNTPGALMLSEAASAHEAVRRQLASNDFAALGERLRTYSPRLIVTAARGSSDHAAAYAKYLIETSAGILTASAAPSVASLYNKSLALDGAVCLAISQSGASPDIIASAQAAKRAGALVIALVNVEDSPLAAEADAVLAMRAGTERSVAATKSYIASLSAILGLVAAWTKSPALAAALHSAPDALQAAWTDDWSPAAPAIAAAANLYVIGRGLGYGVAAEAALKLKEVARIHAEAYSAAELRHGPMSLIEPRFPVLMFAQDDETKPGIEQLASDLAERGADIYSAGVSCKRACALPFAPAHRALAPLLMVQSFYRLAHAIALLRGCDPDRPPHLAKVTRTF